MSMSHCSSNKADLCNVRNVRTGRHARVPTLRSVWPGEQGCHLTWSPQKLGHKLAHECTNRMEPLKKSLTCAGSWTSPLLAKPGVQSPPSTGVQGGDCTNPLVPAPSSGFLHQEWTQICLLQVDQGQHHWVLLGIREGVLFALKKSQVGSTTAHIKLLF